MAFWSENCTVGSKGKQTKTTSVSPTNNYRTTGKPTFLVTSANELCTNCRIPNGTFKTFPVSSASRAACPLPAFSQQSGPSLKKLDEKRWFPTERRTFLNKNMQTSCVFRRRWINTNVLLDDLKLVKWCTSEVPGQKQETGPVFCCWNLR